MKCYLFIVNFDFGDVVTAFGLGGNTAFIYPRYKNSTPNVMNSTNLLPEHPLRLSRRIEKDLHKIGVMSSVSLSASATTHSFISVC